MSGFTVGVMGVDHLGRPYHIPEASRRRLEGEFKNAPTWRPQGTFRFWIFSDAITNPGIPTWIRCATAAEALRRRDSSDQYAVIYEVTVPVDSELRFQVSLNAQEEAVASHIPPHFSPLRKSLAELTVKFNLGRVGAPLDGDNAAKFSNLLLEHLAQQQCSSWLEHWKK